jgi:energy-coupling factor transport system ATP-binding protein
MPIIIKDLGFAYFDRTVLDGASVSLDEGLVHLLIGGTGSGKTTLALIITGLIRPTRGSVRVDDCDPASGKFDRTRLQLAFQFPEVQIFESSVEREIEYGLKNFGLPPAEIAARREWAMACVGLSPAFLPHDPAHLSFGERRKTALASVIALKPKYLILDEPLAGLDWRGRRHLVETVARLKAEGLTTLILTHETDLMAETGDAITVVEDGRVAGPMSAGAFLGSCERTALIPAFADVVRKVAAGMRAPGEIPRRPEDSARQVAGMLQSGPR